MDALVLAAGKGSRLAPLTDRVPKPLLDVGGESLLARAVQAVAGAGASRIFVNVHHLPLQVIEALSVITLSCPLVVSDETTVLLDTGGAVAQVLRQNAVLDSLLIHNGDIWTEADLNAFLRSHEASGADASLMVKDRPTSRKLAFREGRLIGRAVSATPDGEAYGYCGITLLSRAALHYFPDVKPYSLIDRLVERASQGLDVRAHVIDASCAWFDIGTHEGLERARRYVSGS